MSFEQDKRRIGERYTARRTAEQPRHISTIPPLPYFPNLKLEINSVTASLVLTYLEIHHPAPQDPLGGLSSPPVTLHLDAICDALQVSRRTLKISLSILGVWWRSEAERFSAYRAGLEFIHPSHTRHGRIKPYSVVGPSGWRAGAIVQLRRNLPRLQQILASANIANLNISPLTHISSPHICHCHDTQDHGNTPHNSQDRKVREGGQASSTPAILREKSRFAELLLRASVLDGDRRKVRYPRLRAAVEAKLEDSKVLSPKQPKRGRNVGVNPILPVGMEERMKRGSR